MTDFASFVHAGLIKKLKADFRQVEKQLRRAEKDLLTVHLVLKKDPEWASTIAYQAMLRAGRALLFAHGFLPADGQQHKTVVELTGRILGPELDALVRAFERLRRKRNQFFYDSEDAENLTEAEQAVRAAGELLVKIRQHINGLNPQRRLNMN